MVLKFESSHVKVAKDSFNWTSCSLVSNRKSCFTRAVLWEGNGTSDAFWDDWKWKSSYPTTDRPSIYFLCSREKRRGRRRKGGRRGSGMDYWRAACICLIPFYLFSLFVFFSSSPTPPLLISSPHLQHTFALPSFNSPPSAPSSSSSLFSSLCLPREKRFCLLLVSAPSQSAFLISSYCFCLIFKCYPGPNGNPYKKKKKKRGERETGWVLCFTPGPRDKSPPTTPTPLKERFGRFWEGAEGWGESGLEDGSQVQSKGGDIFSWCLLAPRTTL